MSFTFLVFESRIVSVAYQSALWILRGLGNVFFGLETGTRATRPRRDGGGQAEEGLMAGRRKQSRLLDRAVGLAANQLVALRTGAGENLGVVAGRISERCS
jgi:hypothetical protein